MKKITAFIPLLLIGLIFVGFGCQKFGGGSPKIATPNNWTLFSSSDYNFSFAYPQNMEVRERPTGQQDSTYVGLPGKFFVSLRDIKRESNPVSIALFYTFKDVDFDSFSKSLIASDPNNITIKETTDVVQGGIAMKKIISSTASGEDKTHYLFQEGENLIVVSVVLGEEETFAPEFATIQTIK